MMKKLQALLLTVLTLCCLTLTSCDKLEKESYEEELSIVLEAEPTSIAALVPDITEVAADYDEDGILTQAMAVFRGNDAIAVQKGLLYYTFCSEDEEAERSTIVIVTYDMASKTVTEVSYEEGNGLFVDAASEPVEPNSIAVTFDSLFQALKDNPSMADKLGGANMKLTMEFTSSGVELSLI